MQLIFGPYYSNPLFLTAKLQISVWKGLLYVLDRTGASESHNLPINEIIQHAILSVNYKNDMTGNTQMEISNENDIKETVLRILSNFTRDDILHSDAWTRIKTLMLENVRNNQNKSSGKITTTQLT